MNVTRTWITIVSLLCLLIILSGTAWVLNDSLFSFKDPQCDINSGRCLISLEDRDLEITLGPMPAKSLIPMQLSIMTTGQQPSHIWADVQGVDMYMGINQFELKQTDHGWQGITELAVCTTDMMKWVIAVYLSVEGQPQQRVNLYFDSEVS